jgi:hypothetical protein
MSNGGRFQVGSVYSERMIMRDYFYGAITTRCREFLAKSKSKRPVYTVPSTKSGVTRRNLARAPPKRILSCPANLDSFDETFPATPLDSTKERARSP